MSFILQIISEFFPISSTLFLSVLNLNNNGIFHIFSGIFFIIIFFKKFLFITKQEILHYFFIILPSIIIGIKYKPIVNNIIYEIMINIIMGIILYITIKRYENYKNNIQNIYLIDTIILGLILSLNGIFPGMSRLGTSLIYLLLRRYNLNYSYKLSLITSIPIIIGKPLYMMILNPNIYFEIKNFIYNQYLLIFIGFLINIFIYYIFIKKINSNFLAIFAIFRIIFFTSFLINFLFIK